MDVRLMCSVLMFYEIQIDDILLLKLFLFISETAFIAVSFLLRQASVLLDYCLGFRGFSFAV